MSVPKKNHLLLNREEVAFFEKTTSGRIVGFEIDGGTAFEGIYKDIILSAKWDDER